MTGLLSAVLLGGLAASAAAQTPPVLAMPTSLPPAVTTATATPTGSTNAQLDAALSDLPVGPLPPPAHPPAGVPGPYFEHDPLLDPAELPQPGWIFEGEVRLINPHVRYWSDIAGPVNLSNGGTDTVSVPGAHLAWAAMPELLIGYRLPSGFGEFTLSGRYFGSVGDQELPGPDGPSSVRTRLDMTVVNFDYRSTEFSLWPYADCMFWAGGQFGNIFFDSRQITPPTLAAAGTGVVVRHVVNRFIGFGPHAGGQFSYFLHNKEWALQGSIDAADLFGRINQGFDETDVAVDATGAPVMGNTQYSSSQSVPTLTLQLGLRWAPNPNTTIFVGGQYEYYWNAGRESEPNMTLGEVYDAGFVFRACFTY
jgi:hypothetical protein